MATVRSTHPHLHYVPDSILGAVIYFLNIYLR